MKFDKTNWKNQRLNYNKHLNEEKEQLKEELASIQNQFTDAINYLNEKFDAKIDKKKRH